MAKSGPKKAPATRVKQADAVKKLFKTSSAPVHTSSSPPASSAGQRELRKRGAATNDKTESVPDSEQEAEPSESSDESHPDEEVSFESNPTDGKRQRKAATKVPDPKAKKAPAKRKSNKVCVTLPFSQFPKSSI